jgi:hypothetical protein
LVILPPAELDDWKANDPARHLIHMLAPRKGGLCTFV